MNHLYVLLRAVGLVDPASPAAAVADAHGRASPDGEVWEVTSRNCVSVERSGDVVTFGQGPTREALRAFLAAR